MDNFFGLAERITSLFKTSTGIDVYSKAQKLVSEYHMLDKIEGGVCVGFSGGADSVMLMCFLLEIRRQMNLSFPIVAVHINHGIRGDEADRDEAFCRNFCVSLGVEFVSKKFDIPKIAKNLKRGLEEVARDIRYAEFANIVLEREDISCVAVAHNSTDNLETVLFNMIRGTGISGMCGISPVRDNIVRPLLSVSKEEILIALESSSIPFVTDSTNLSTAYTRNYIRHEILPHLAKISHSPEDACFRMTSNLLIDKSYIDSVCDEFFDKQKDPATLLRNELLSLHVSVATRVIKKLAHNGGASIESVHIKKIFSLLNENCDFSYSLPNFKRFICSRGKCFISEDKPDEVKREYCYPLTVGENIIEDLGVRIIVSSSPIPKIYSNVYNFSIHAYTSSAIIDNGLCVRNRKNGDQYRFGNLTRKIKKLFNDKKLPSEIRDVMPLICDDLGIIWIPGFKVRDVLETKEGRELYISFEIKDKGSILYDFFKNKVKCD